MQSLPHSTIFPSVRGILKTNHFTAPRSFTIRYQRDDLGVAFRFPEGQQLEIILISRLIGVFLCSWNFGRYPTRTGRGRVVPRVVEATSGFALSPTRKSYLLFTANLTTSRKVARDLAPEPARGLPSRHCPTNLDVPCTR